VSILQNILKLNKAIDLPNKLERTHKNPVQTYEQRRSGGGSSFRVALISSKLPATSLLRLRQFSVAYGTTATASSMMCPDGAAIAGTKRAQGAQAQAMVRCVARGRERYGVIRPPAPE